MREIDHVLQWLQMSWSGVACGDVRSSISFSPRPKRGSPGALYKLFTPAPARKSTERCGIHKDLTIARRFSGLHETQCILCLESGFVFFPDPVDEELLVRFFR